MTNTPSLLHAALSAVCPIDGVAGPIVPPSPWAMYASGDGTQWRIDFRSDASEAQRQTAISLLSSYSEVAPQPTVTGNQWAFALAALGLASAWQVAVAKSKAKDQVRVGLIARDTSLLASDPLLARVSANAGVTASGSNLIDAVAVFSRAQGMPT